MQDRGSLTFGEFASWAGPRLGLPLGGPPAAGPRACGVLGCPCGSLRTEAPRGPCAGGCGSGRTWRPGGRGRRCRHLLAQGGQEQREGEASSCGRDPDCNGVSLCLCGHKPEAHAQGLPSACEFAFPASWSHVPAQGKLVELVELTAGECESLQWLLDTTHRRPWMRDARRQLPAPDAPEGFRLLRAFRVEHAAAWQRYCARRRRLADRGAPALPGEPLAGAAWPGGAPPGSERLAAEANEWYVFHGASPAVAESICRGDFQLKGVYPQQGAMYGRGLYCAESITKTDESAIANDEGECTVLLCRALGGRVRRVEEEEFDPEELLRDCVEGPFDCVMGGPPAHRELVFFDAEHLYAEYLIQYARKP